jgi:hypothetical protein
VAELEEIANASYLREIDNAIHAGEKPAKPSVPLNGDPKHHQRILSRVGYSSVFSDYPIEQRVFNQKTKRDVHLKPISLMSD